MTTPRMLANANKFAYLVKVYPEKNVNEIINLFRLSPIDINCAIWVAVELDWVKIEERTEVIPELDKKGKVVGEKTAQVPWGKVTNPPSVWGFGEDMDELEDTIVYAFQQINGKKDDMEENYLSSWLAGYAPQDTLVAVKHLIDGNVLYEYQIEDGENKYIFYTLKKNKGKNWGEKQFKKNPLTDEVKEKKEKKNEA